MANACTTGLASADGTDEGRCLLWKNRDSSHRNNEMVFLSRADFDLIGVINADDTTQIWAGVNNFGFAIMNAEARDMARPGEKTIYDEEGYFMKAALLSCRTVADFESMLISTNDVGRGVTSNFGVIDAGGAAAFFETGNHEYFRYDGTDTHVCPAAFLTRANFAEKGYGREGYGQGRSSRAAELFESNQQEKLSAARVVSEITRDVDGFHVGNEYADSDFLSTTATINRHRTVSCSVFESTLANEDPRLTTYWITLGEPAVSVALPLWVLAGEVPAVMDGAGSAPLNLLFQELKAYVYPDTSRSRDISALRLAEIQRKTDRVQKWVFRKTRRKMNQWRRSTPAPAEVAVFQEKLTARVIKDIEGFSGSLKK